MDFTAFKFSLSTPAEIENTKRRTLQILQRKEKFQGKPDHGDVSDELRHYLRLIHRTPGIASTQRDKKNGISAAKGSRLRKKLLELDLITESKIKQGRGRPLSDIRLTEKAEKYLKTTWK